ncbi:Hypp8206 [Branchiostoma lanceolatum]|uniref:Hypp8206 protein n=1 Tax=Branchiostoma lanceolatum TaxID=7740 RepID=A0A8K0EH05_BRALA|nr:Hypp8206 [Branchiostoma lanceolatum]
MDSWTEKSRRQVDEVLYKEYMSSESSDSDMEGRPYKVFKVRRLAWESLKLRKLKKWMDDVCPSRSIRRVESTELSDRKLPEAVPKWAVSKNFGKSTEPTAENGGGDEEQGSSFLDLE